MAKTESQNKPNTEFTFNPEAHKAKENKNKETWQDKNAKKEKSFYGDNTILKCTGCYDT